MNIGGILLAMQGAVSQGILWGVLVLGVYITYKILDIADLTGTGSGPCSFRRNDCGSSHGTFTYSL